MSVQSIKTVKGMRDILDDKMSIHNTIMYYAMLVARGAGFRQIQTPILEYSEIFHSTLGDTSDIVTKETYTFEDRDGRLLTMRPEFTAAVVRAFITNGLTQTLPQKFFSCGPLFRHERAQKGRYREFNQINVEYIGAKTFKSDVEIITLAQRMLELFSIEKAITLEINTLGDDESRGRYRNILIEYFNDNISSLSEESRSKIYKNPLRILDSKIDTDKKIINNSPKIKEYLNSESKNYYENILELLKKLDVRYKENDKIVRGMDYYNHTVFEFTTDILGAQNAIIAGGRYNKLVHNMGGPCTSAIGFAGGVERIEEMITIMKVKEKFLCKQISIGIIPVENYAEEKALILANELRDKSIDKICSHLNFNILLEYDTSLKKSMKKYDAAKVDAVVIIGEEELKDNSVNIRDMNTGIEEKVKYNNIYKYLVSKYTNEK